MKVLKLQGLRDFNFSGRGEITRRLSTSPPHPKDEEYCTFIRLKAFSVTERAYRKSSPLSSFCLGRIASSVVSFDSFRQM